MLSPATEFQSALPLRGATGAYTGNFRNAMEFQSALPLRGATRDCRTALIGPGRISIRAPLAGSDGRPDGRPGFYVISIRAPLAGSDTRAYSLRYTHRHFNPRSPCGERPGRFGTTTRSSRFQSALPLRGATQHIRPETLFGEFQSALPLRGATEPFPGITIVA